MHSHFTALFDASVLYPATLRNVLVQLATTGMFRARWTDAIHDEWSRALRRDRSDITAKKVARIRELMNRAVPDCLVTGYEPLIERLTLPDPDDHHVLAAAIRCSADVIVTANLRHFPPESLVPLQIRAEHPDEFVRNLIDLDTATVCDALKTVRQRLKNPPYTPTALLDLLDRQGLTETAETLRSDADWL